jgi:hypothetical protein
LTLRTLLLSRPKDNTREVNNRCIPHELAGRSNRLRKRYLICGRAISYCPPVQHPRVALSANSLPSSSSFLL